MKYGVLGTGMVGDALATKLAQLGHEVMMGGRSADHKNAQAWLAKVRGAKGTARIGTFADAAKFGETILNCTQGSATLEALKSVDAQDLAGKILIDVANPLDFSSGTMTLTIVNSDSLGESIQRAYPAAKVVKTLNTVNIQVMVNPVIVPGDHDLFICGEDAGAKQQVTALLREFGWRSIIDLGGIVNARATEQLMPIWMRLFTMFGSPLFNFKIVKT
jgi:Predicted dinucleotide-binding enzymes